jgi:hypothetical protein
VQAVRAQVGHQARPLSDRHLAIAARLCFLLAALILILTAALEGRACADTLDALVITSAAADLGTTEWALGRPGLHELNPLMQDPPRRAMVKTLGTIAVVGGGRYLDQHGHRNWSRGLRIAVVIAWSGLAVSNAIQAGRGR